MGENGADVLFRVVEKGRAVAQWPPAAERELEFIDVSALPLTTPIVAEARHRRLRGHCSNCGASVTIKVRHPGKLRVRCPVCGHARTLHV